MSRALAAAAVLVLAAAVAACGGSPGTPAATVAQGAGAPAALPLEVDVATAARLQAEGAFVLDVREPDEWAGGHIAGATLIPLGRLQARVAEVPPDRRVVVVCRSGNRSAQGRDILLAAGRAGVTSMAGGINEWAAAGNAVVTGD